jgi:hypothetical protein
MLNLRVPTAWKPAKTRVEVSGTACPAREPTTRNPSTARAADDVVAASASPTHYCTGRMVHGRGGEGEGVTLPVAPSQARTEHCQELLA